MAPLPVTKPTLNVANEEEEESISLEKNDSTKHKELTNPNQKRKHDQSIVFYQGFYLFSWLLPNIMTFQEQFQPQDTDIIVATKPKSGTTWLKSLVYSILHRTHFNNTNHPLLTKNPHELAPCFEFDIYTLEKQPDLMLESMASPRLLSTHLPYGILPKSIKAQSKCKIVYMARNPLDTVVSAWTFAMQVFPWINESMSFDAFVENFCKGYENYGPHWDHVLEYWKESLKRPNKVLFLKYEDIQVDGVSVIKQLAKFLDLEFSEQEERQGAIQEILKLCSIDHLKNLEVNKTGNLNPTFKNTLFFRKGEVGDWVNHLSPVMMERLNHVMSEKFDGSGLEFKTRL